MDLDKSKSEFQSVHSPKYKDKLNYEGLLLTQIQSVLNAINYGQSGITQTENLLASLLPDILTEISDDVKKAQSELSIGIHRANKSVTNPIFSYVADNTIANLQCDYSRTIVKLVIEALDNRALLLTQERQLDTGGY